MKRKALSLVLAMLIILASFPLTAFAVDGEKTITKIEMKGTKPIIENLNGYWEGDWFYYHDYSLVSTAEPDVIYTYSDGSTKVIEWDSYYDYFMDYSVDYSQSSENHYKLGENTMTVYIDSDHESAATFSFTIIKNPVKSITVTPQNALIEKVSGFWDVYDDDDEDGVDESTEYFYYDLDLTDPIVTVEYNDGTPKFTGTKSELYDATGYYLSLYGGGYDNAFKVGKNTAKASFMGIETTFEFEMKANPIKSLTVTPKKAIIEKTNGYWDYYQDGNESVKYFHYYLSDISYDVTVEYNDGTPTFTGSRWDLYDETGYELEIVSDQDDKPFTVGLNKAKALFMGFETEFTIEIKKSPVKSLTVTPVKPLIENAGGRWAESQKWNEEIGDFEYTDFFYYDIAFANLNLTIEFNDGTPTFKGTVEELDEADLGDLLGISTNQYETPFKVGLNTVKAEFMGVETEFTIEVKKTPVKSVTVTPQKTLMENLDGYWDEYEIWDEETDDYEWIECFWYDLTDLNPIVTVEFNDGTPTFSGSTSKLQSETGYTLVLSGNDQYKNPFKLGKNTAKASFMGVETTFEFEIVKTIVKNIKVTLNEPLMENVSGYWTTDYDGNNYFYYNILGYDHEITVEFNDGTTITGSESDLEAEFDWDYEFEIKTEQSENPLKVGKNSVKATFMGYETTFDVQIIESPIKSISVKSLKSLQEHEDGWWRDIEDEDTWEIIGQWWYYSFSDKDLEVTINFKDTTKPSVTYRADKLFDVFEAELKVDLNQSSSKPLTVGKHQGKATFMGVSCNFDFTIIENQVKSISAKPTKDLMAYYDGYYTNEDGEESFYYYVSRLQPEITVTYLDGTKKTFSYAYLNNVSGVGIDIDQDKELTVGTHTAKISYHGRECDFKFNIVKNNIKNIVVTPTRDLVEYEDGYFSETADGEEFFRYNLDFLKPNLTINYTDGKSVTYDYFTARRVLQDRLYLYNDQYEKGQLKLGVNTATAEFNNFECEFKFNIVKSKNAITGLTVTPNAALLENIDGWYEEYYDGESDDYITCWRYDESDITYNVVVKYADGTTKTFKNVSNYDVLNGIEFSVDFNQNNKSQYKVGKNTATASYGKVQSNFQVEVKANPYTAVTVSGDTELIFTLTKADGTKEVVKAVNAVIGGGDEKSYSGHITTDTGLIFDFSVSYELASDKVTHKNLKFELFDDGKNSIKSNVLASNKYFDTVLKLIGSNLEYAVGAYAGGYDKSLTGKELNGLSGTITGVNVDHALTICSFGNYYAEYEICGIDDKGYYAYLTIDEAKELVKKYFDVSKIDFTSSPNYNSTTKKIKVRFIESIYYIDLKNEKLVYENNQFVYTYDVVSRLSYEEIPVTLVLAKDGTISSVSFVKGACGEIKTISAQNVNKGVKVTYSASENANQYEIYRSTNGGKYEKVGTTSELSYVDTTVASGKTYTYKVRGVNANTTGSFSGTKTVSYLAMPKTTASISKTGFTVKWNKVNGASTYRIYRAEYANGKWSNWNKLTDQKASVTSYADKNVKAGGVYKYTVRAMASGGVASAYEGTSTLIYLTTPTVKIANAKGGVKGSWNAVAGAEGYIIYRSEYNASTKKWSNWTNLGTTKAATRTFTDKTAVSGKTYRYTVKAINGNNSSLYTASNTLLYLAEPTVTIGNAKAGITVKWTKSAGAKGFTIYRAEYNAKTKKWSSWSNMGTTKGTVSSWTDKSAKAGATYKYTVRAVSNSVKSTYTASASLIRLAETKVTISNAKTGVTVKWGKVAGAKNYIIYRAEYVNGKWSSWKNMGSKANNVLSWTDTSALSGTTYRYTVKSTNGKSTSSYTASSNTLFLAQPTTKIANASNGIKVSWNAVNGATGYTVYRSEYNAKTKKWSSWSNKGTAKGTATSWTDKKVTSGVYYKYTVRAVNGSFKSTYTSSAQLLYLAQPTVTVAKAATGVSVKWNKVAGAKNYIIYRQEMVDGKWSNWVNLTTTKANVNSYTDKSAESGKEYRYTVRVVNGSYKSTYKASSSVKR